MTDAEKLKRIADLFGGASKLAREIGLDRSGVVRRLSGDTHISFRDWVCVKAAVAKRVEDLQAALSVE